MQLANSSYLPPTEAEVTINRVVFRNFKALRDFSFSLEHVNLLVGPNNAGKSTIIGAFRALAAALQTARARRSEVLPTHQGLFGYRVPRESIPISLENAQTDLQDVEATVSFYLSNQNRLVLSFPPSERDCFLIPEANRRVTNIASFNVAFPISLTVVPTLGPVEHDEEIVELETVRRNLSTHRASRHFRNYWRYYPQQFVDFREWVTRTWSGMDIDRPQVASDVKTLAMFCVEGRITRELYWIGTGFQVWCQLLTHILRGRSGTLLVIDEAEIYLHPDLQRRLLSILRDLGPDIVLATHSTELVGEAEPTEIVVIDKQLRSAQRVRTPEDVQQTLSALGSIHTMALTQLARLRHVLFVEGDDFKLLRKFAKQIDLDDLSEGRNLVLFPLGGFTAPERVRSICLGIRSAVGVPLAFAAIFDRDFRSNEEIHDIVDELKGDLAYIGIPRRKEIENYLLVPSSLDRALTKAAAEREKRTGNQLNISSSMLDLLDEITTPMKSELQAQYIAKRTAYLRLSGKDPATIGKEVIQDFDHKWGAMETRMELVPGKRVFSQIVTRVQQDYGVTLTASAVIRELSPSNVPSDLAQLLRELDRFRETDPSIEAST